jgi:hypothetical protein
MKPLDLLGYIILELSKTLQKQTAHVLQRAISQREHNELLMELKCQEK